MTGGALELLASMLTDQGVRWGDLAVDWQWADARAVLEPGEGEPRQHWLGRPKGGSKTTDVAAMGLAWLVEQAPELADGYVVASDEEQAARLLDRARGFVSRTPALGAVVRVEATRIVNVRSGARVHALAADVAGGEGLLAPFAVAEELPNWNDTPTARGMWTLLASSLPKWRGARLVVIGHAGSPSHWAYRVLEHAHRSKAWRVVEIPGPLPWVSEDSLAEQRALLLPSEYARRHLNQWAEGEDRLVLVDDLRACVTLDGPQLPRPGPGYVMSLDMGYVKDAAVAAVAHRDADGRVALDLMEVWQGSRRRPVREADVEDWLMESWRAYGRPTLVCDPWQTKGMAQRLRSRGVNVTEFVFSAQSVGRLGLGLYRALRDQAVALYPDDGLLDELARVRLAETAPGVYRLAHGSSEHDDRAVALALLVHTLTEHGVPMRSSIGNPARQSLNSPARGRSRLDIAVRAGHRARAGRIIGAPRSRQTVTRLDGSTYSIPSTPRHVEHDPHDWRQHL